MKKLITTRWTSLLLILIATLGSQLSAQTDVQFVELDLRNNEVGDSLLVYVRITGPTDFTGSVNEIKYTLRWQASGPSDITIDPGSLTQFCASGFNILYYQTTPQYPTSGAGAGYAYATMNAFGLPPISQSCPDQVWPVGQWRLNQRLGVLNLNAGECHEFQIVNDGFTAVSGRETYIELMGQEIDHSVEATPALIGGCIIGISRNQGHAMSFWPNPASDVLHITSGADPMVMSTISIMDSHGRIVKVMDRNIPASMNMITVPVADLADGMYTIRIENGDHTSSHRFVKML